jgi:hypothetical protein
MPADASVRARTVITRCLPQLRAEYEAALRQGVAPVHVALLLLLDALPSTAAMHGELEVYAEAEAATTLAAQLADCPADIAMWPATFAEAVRQRLPRFGCGANSVPCVLVAPPLFAIMGVSLADLFERGAGAPAAMS